MANNPDPRRVLWYGLSAMFILVGIAAVLSVIFNNYTFPGTFYGWMGIVGGVVGMLIGLFFLFIFIWVIIWFGRSIGWISRSSRYYNHEWRWWDHDDAMEIIRERYAKGEISKEQYDKIRIWGDDGDKTSYWEVYIWEKLS